MYEIVQRIVNVAYELYLHSELIPFNLVFYVSMHKKYIVNPVSVFSIEGLGVDENLFYEEVSVEIVDSQIKKLMNKEVVSEKGLWRNHLGEGAIWEADTDMKSHYPYLFLKIQSIFEVSNPP